MKKIRINELARELEVKPGIILDLLPELGVQEKKTHSSSIEEDTAIALKEKLAKSGFLGSFPNRANGHHDGEDGDGSAETSDEAVHTEAPAAPTTPAAASPAAQEPVSPATPSGPSSFTASQRFPLRVPVRQAPPAAEPAPRGIGIPPSTAPTPSPVASAPTAETAASAPAAPAPEPERPAIRFQPLRPPLGAAGNHPAPGAPAPAPAVPSQPAPQAAPAPSAPTSASASARSSEPFFAHGWGSRKTVAVNSGSATGSSVVNECTGPAAAISQRDA